MPAALVGEQHSRQTAMERTSSWRTLGKAGCLKPEQEKEETEKKTPKGCPPNSFQTAEGRSEGITKYLASGVNWDRAEDDFNFLKLRNLR